MRVIDPPGPAIVCSAVASVGVQPAQAATVGECRERDADAR